MSASMGRGDVMPVVVLGGQQRPHEVLLLALSVVIGVAYFLGSPAPGSLAALIPHWEIIAWAVGLIISGALGLVGCLLYHRDLETGLRLEFSAMLMGAGANLIYAFAVFSLGGWRALVAGGMTVAWVSANLWRCRQIRRDLAGRSEWAP